MTGQRYEVQLTHPVRHALAERLPQDVAVGAMDFIYGPLATSPHRVGKRLDPPYDGIHPARLMREYRILYVVDDDHRRVTVRSIRHRRDSYRT